VRVEIRQLKAFILVAEKLHFGQAATALHLTQPALSRTVQQLEEAIGEPLLIRSNRSVSLTEAGRVFLEKAQRIVDDLDDAIELTRQAAGGEKGRLRIGYTDMAILGKLPDVLHAFRSRYPGVEVEMIYAPNTPQLHMLEDERLDFAFVSGVIQAEGFDTRVVQDDRFVVLLPPGHPLAEKAELTLADLRGEPFVIGMRQNWRDYRRHLDAIFLEQRFEPRIVQEAYNSQAVFAFVAAGMGVSIHIESARRWMGDRVAVRPLTGVDATFQTSALWRSDGDSPLKRHFLEHLYQALKA
jgi:DNA-binding transcriptional LysR family regulator